MTWVDKGQDRGSKAQRGTGSAINAHTHIQKAHTNTHMHTHSTQAGPKTKSSWRGEARPGQVFEAPTVAAASAAASSHTKKRAQSSEEEEAKQRREKNSLPLLLFFIYFLFFFKYTSSEKKCIFILCVRDGAGSRAQHLRPVLLRSLSRSPSPSHCCFVC